MEVILLNLKKTKNQNLKNLIDEYEKRINHYVKFSNITISDFKNLKKLSPYFQKEKEADLILKQIKNGDLVILLDEKGLCLNSKEFSRFLNKKYNSNFRRIIFVIGGAYGFAESVTSLKFEKLSLSKMTFTHQMTSLFFCEQLYRANTILKNEKYHH